MIDLNEHTIAILGTPNFVAGSIAILLRKGGHGRSVGRPASRHRVGAIPQPAQHRYRDSRVRAAVTGQPRRESHLRHLAPQLFNRHPR